MSKNGFVMRVMSEGPAGIHFGRLRYSKSNLTAQSKVQARQETLWAKVEQDASLSLLYRVIWLSLLLFSFLHACHSCCLAMQRERGREMHCKSPVISLYGLLFYEATFCDSVCDDVRLCFFPLRPSAIMLPPVVMVAPSKQSGMSSFSCLWHGLTHVWSGHHDGLHGCQWKPRWAGSGFERGGSRDLHDCVQEPLGSGKCQR